MSLDQYQEKRNFSQTPEPKGKEKPRTDVLRFVVQKHDASSLHYDFRLEMEGVLKSWAVPKGPSLDPADKRLAVMVEDHPFEYRNFEGVIPEGNYGSGAVIVWDEGIYEAYKGGSVSKKEQELQLLAGLEKGSLRLTLHGQKLKGVFQLMRLKRGGANAWLLVKVKDEFASTEDITKEAASVKSGKTLADIAAANGVALHHPQTTETNARTPENKKATTDKSQGKKTPETIAAAAVPAKGIKKAPMPRSVKPMLATLIDAPFDNEDWLFEVKWDGYRAIAYKAKNSVELLSRNDKSFAKRYAPVTEALKQLKVEAVFDGELVAVNEKGVAYFQLLQNWQTKKEGHLRYYIFDLLWLNGKDLTHVPLLERKRILQGILPANDAVLFYSDHVVGKGTEFFNVALEQGLEGIMAKKGDSFYASGSRTESWLKIKVARRQEVVIAGFTQPRNSRQFFGALLLGVYQGKELVYVGHTGSGFDRDSLEAIYKKLQPLITDTAPFALPPKTNMPATWVKPKLVCEIKFTEWTRDGQARHPIFMGLRDDKPATSVKKELEQTVPRSKGKAENVRSAAGKSSKPAGNTSTITDPAAATDQAITIKGKTVQLTNLQKPYWKEEGFTKGDMIRYYAAVMPYLFPYLKDRPQSLHRHPNGVEGTQFFQKDMKGKIPDWIPTYEDFSESTGKPVHYLVCDSEAAVLYMANMGCIELHPFHSRVQQIDHPDYCVLDLDPHTGSTFEQVIEAAQVVHKILEHIGAKGYCKTSGSSGLHVYIPFGARYPYSVAKTFAEGVVTLVQKELPKTTSLERNPAKRKGKIYLDWLQNTLTQTAAAAYSLRPKRGMPVSTPLHWEEVKKGLTPTTWNARNLLERLRVEGDLFAPVLKKGLPLERALTALQALL